MKVESSVNFLGSVIGCVIGGMSWIVLAGISIDSPFWVLFPLICGAAIVFASHRLYKLHPERNYSILGIAILGTIMLGIISAQFVYDKIPETAFGVSTNKGMYSLQQVNILLGVLSLIGFFFMIIDVLTAPKKSA
ncbi:MAG: hypothetical protein V1875_04100 [Candidatus Altiarchaeota archaeon]